MRTATRLRVTSSGVTTYAGGPPRLLGEASLVQPVVLLEFAVHSREPMMGAKIKGYLRDARWVCSRGVFVGHKLCRVPHFKEQCATHLAPLGW